LAGTIPGALPATLSIQQYPALGLVYNQITGYLDLIMGSCVMQIGL